MTEDVPPIAAGIRGLAEAAIQANAVAATLIYETRDGECFAVSFPDLHSTRKGLVAWAWTIP